jgi:hypothetical protein
MYKVENEKRRKREEMENRERVFVPIRHQELTNEEQTLEKPSENIWKIPRRWHV